MLTAISIKNFTLVRDLHLSLFEGLTVFTGETGAGKSILIEALQYALGVRADSGVVRQGSQQADITAQFEIEAIPKAMAWLKEQEWLSEESVCLLRRIIFSDGRSKHFINGYLATQHQVRSLGEFLISIHGQYETQGLLKTAYHLQLLDRFAGHEALLNQVKKAYQVWETTQRSILDLQKRSLSSQQLELLQYQIEELSRLNLQEGEYEQLNQAHQVLAHKATVSKALQSAVQQLLTEESGASSLIQKAQKEIQSVLRYEPNLNPMLESLEQIYLQLSEIEHQLQARCECNKDEGDALEKAESRLQILYHTARKYKVAPQDLPQFAKRLQAESDLYQNTKKSFTQLEKQCEIDLKNYQTVADQLSENRKKFAEQLIQLIKATVSGLGMPHSQFAIRFNRLSSPAGQGQETVEFFMSANLGEPLKPLNKTASGGELSRISLALYAAAADQQNIPTLIFDEVDVGIGGSIAEVIGQLLRKLAKKTQVFCITHLPQVAAYGQNHIKVDKGIEGDKTLTELKWLSEKDRIQELARMSGGIKITRQTVEHVKAMLKRID